MEFRSWAGRRLRLLVGAAIAVSCLATAASMATAAPEYQLKAVFLFQFAQFVEWPDKSSVDDVTPFTICVLGDDPFHEYLDETVHGEVVKGRPLAVRRYREVHDLANCNIAFIAQSEMDRLGSILDALRGQPVLTVSDSARFAERGGTIQFVTLNNRLRLRINAQAAKASELTISSKLLQLADIVTPQRS